MAAQIAITFDKTGNSSVAVTGVKGGNCESLTKPLIDALGKQTGSDPTPERYETEPVRETVSQGTL